MRATHETVTFDAASDGALREFFAGIPEGDRTFFRDDVMAEGTLEAWRADRTSRRVVGVEGERVVGLVSVVPGVGWMAHVGELRVVVAPDCRRRGWGRALARQGLLAALDLGLGKVVVEVAADDEPSAAMFVALGFWAEAILQGHIRDRQGQLHDLLVLAHVVDETWGTLAVTGVADEVARPD